MTEFLLVAAAFILLMDRIMAAQLLGTGGVAALLLLGTATSLPGAIDVAVTLALLAAFAAVILVRSGGSS
jgi:multicomponent Na+:H+ antiporter subunit F